MSVGFVYRLADPAEMKRHDGALERQLIGRLAAPPSDPFFDMSETSGGFRYFDEGRLWNPDRPGILAGDAEEVIQTCRRFFSEVNRGLSRYREATGIRKISLPDPFPQQRLRHKETLRIFEAGSDRADHWLSYWMLQLPVRPSTGPFSGEQRTAPVYGAVVEVRVGLNNVVEGVVSSLRPWISVIRTPLYGSGDNSAGSLVYVMESIHEPQIFLSPFYDRNLERRQEPEQHHNGNSRADSGGQVHGSMLRPACDYSLIIDISLDIRQRMLVVAPLMADPRGVMVPVPRDGYRLSWVYADIDAQIDDSYSASRHREIELESPGMYHIELSVEDLRTGAMRSTFREIAFGSEDLAEVQAPVA